MFLHMSVHGGGGGGIPACLAAGLWGCDIPACFAGFQAHTKGGMLRGLARGVPVPGGACSRGSVETPPVMATAAGGMHPTRRILVNICCCIVLTAPGYLRVF